MMEAKDFRIGNLIMVNYNTDILSEVSFIQQHSIQVEFEMQSDLVNGMCLSPNKAMPIHLTEEWLIKMGFVFLKRKIGTQGVYTNGKMNLHISNNGNVYRINKIIQHVNQLQNLYFCLYEEELIIKK